MVGQAASQTEQRKQACPPDSAGCDAEKAGALPKKMGMSQK